MLRDSGYEVTADQVVVTNGGKQAVYESFQVLLNDGDEVIIPTPFWTSYPEAVKLAGGKPVEVFAGRTAASVGAESAQPFPLFTNFTIRTISLLSFPAPELL